jgi:transcriptional regulator with XRE-family HTH domain
VNLNLDRFTMPTADDGTQDRIIEAIDAAAAARALSQKEISTYLGISPQQWSNVKAGSQVLAPWMLRKLAKLLRTAGPVVGVIAAAGGEEVVRIPEADGMVDALSAAMEAIVLLGGFTAEARDAQRDDSPGGRTVTADEKARLRARLAPLRRLVNDLDHWLAGGAS